VAIWGAALALSFLLPSTIAFAQRTIPITGDRLSGIVLPVEPLDGDIELHATRGAAWTVDDTKRLLLTEDVAVVWINRLPSAEGLINQIAVYFDHVENPTHRAGLGVAGTRLLITGSTRGEVRLEVTLLDRGRPDHSSLLERGEERLAMHLRRLLGERQNLHRWPRVERPKPPHEFAPVPGGVVEEKDYELPAEVELPPVDGKRPWLRRPGAIVTFSADRIDVVPGEEENTITAMGSMIAEYFDLKRSGELSQMILSADRAVIFTEPGTLEEMAAWELDVSLIHGIYLEGHVVASADDGEYVVRAPRVYYDFTTGQAIMLDAVLRTYTRDGKVPIYARAAEMRQVAENQWKAQRIRVSTSEFYTCHLALGAERMTVTRRPIEEGGGVEHETYFDARDITLRAGGLPFFYWPQFKGTVRDIPIKSIELGSRDNDGVRIETVWDLYSLLGGERPKGVEADLKLDAFTKRGVGAGLTLDYDAAAGYGEIELYSLYDDGVDRTSAGLEVARHNELRGLALWEHRMELARHWSLQAQTSYISDETFISAWREDDFEERREYETSLYVKHQKDRAALTALLKYEVNPFISNSWLLASTQYRVEKLPELTYERFGDPLFGDEWTYSGETRLSRMRLVLDRTTPRQLGVRGRAFGIGEDEQLSDMLRARGLETRYVARFDSRHEFSIPTTWRIFDVTPFFVGRLTAYDDDFDAYSSDSDAYRLFGAAGLRINTQFQHVDDRVESRLLDLHRLRHIVEPSMTLWYGYANVAQDDLPVYDLEVESLATGAAVRMGVRNTWQTQRGGPGRWRSVDALTVDTDVVFNSDDAERESPAPQFFDYRPEYSQFGDHARASLLWLLSDTLALSGESIYDLDESSVARGSIGAEMRHSPVLRTYAEFRYLEASDDELLDVGWDYQLTPKYRILISPQWDLREEEFRAVRLRIVRIFPDFELTFQIRHDEIRNDTTFAASIDLVEF
jgi:hypothetical protein